MQQLQLDELYALLRDVKAGAISEKEAIEHLERSPHWVWTAIDPQSKLLLTIDVGPRTLAMAQAVVHQVVQVALHQKSGHKNNSFVNESYPSLKKA